MFFMQIVFILCLAALLLYRCRFVKWNDSYIDKASTSTINGLFIWLVFISHFTQYLPACTRNVVGCNLGQLIVVMFLFYSGYGCAFRYNEKGEQYLKPFLKKRILTTLVNFDVAVCLFIATGLLLGKSFAVKRCALSLIAWDSVGNSNWYIFIILLSYTLFWISTSVLNRWGNVHRQKWRIWQIVLVSCLAVAVVALSRIKPGFWSDTIMAFGAGVVYGANRDYMERFAKKYYWFCIVIAVFIFISIDFCPVIGSRYWLSFNIKSIAFALLIVMITMRVSFNSALLRWSGENLFPLYIYQRIPMIVFSTLFPTAFQDGRCWIYFAISAVIAIAFAALYPRFRLRCFNQCR